MSLPNSVRITDIAAAAGVSATTVSRVLNNKQGNIRISEKTREHVHEVANKLGYQRNPLASALRSNRTGIIGAINRAVSGTYMSRLAHHIQLVAQSRNIELFVGAPRENSDAIAGQLSVLQSHLFDGVLFLGDLASYQTSDFALPLVHVVPGNEELLPLVTVDEAQGVKLALDYLTQLGHTKIACLGSPAWPWDGRRVQFYSAYMAEHLNPKLAHIIDLNHIPYPANSALETDVSDTVLEHVQQAIEGPSPPTALFCTNDGFGANAIKALYRLGLRVPENVSVVGYGNHHDANIIYPELTTVHIPNQQLADVALDLLLRIIKDPENTELRGQRLLCEPALVIRQSTSDRAR